MTRRDLISLSPPIRPTIRLLLHKKYYAFFFHQIALWNGSRIREKYQLMTTRYKIWRLLLLWYVMQYKRTNIFILPFIAYHFQLSGFSTKTDNKCGSTILSHQLLRALFSMLRHAESQYHTIVFIENSRPSFRTQYCT